MSTDKYAQQLPEPARGAVINFLSISSDIKATWSEAKQAKYELICKVITRKSRKTGTEWTTMESVMLEERFPEFLQVIAAFLDTILPFQETNFRNEVWTKKENKALDVIFEWIPRPEIVDGDRLRMERVEVLQKSEEGYIGQYIGSLGYGVYRIFGPLDYACLHFYEAPARNSRTCPYEPCPACVSSKAGFWGKVKRFFSKT